MSRLIAGWHLGGPRGGKCGPRFNDMSPTAGEAHCSSHVPIRTRSCLDLRVAELVPALQRLGVVVQASIELIDRPGKDGLQLGRSHFAGRSARLDKRLAM